MAPFRGVVRWLVGVSCAVQVASGVGHGAFRTSLTLKDFKEQVRHRMQQFKVVESFLTAYF